MKFKIGVIGLQGDVSEHASVTENALSTKGSVIIIRKAGVVPGCSGLVLPGGESTTLSRLLSKSGIDHEILRAAADGVPVLATCAGLVLVSREVCGDSKVKTLGLMDITVDRNAFGSQRESFEADLNVEGFARPYRAAFIRAPAIVGAGTRVKILARLGEDGVAASQDNVLALAFHPELTDDQRFHKLFLDMIKL